MKPVSVRFQCFGPYVQEQYIDFRELEKNGIFLICGETGAGKTTILDAICYALYGRSSGGLRGDLSVMRCKLADKSEETLVEFIFDSGGKRYKFIRTLKYGRKNLNDTHNCLVQEGEVYVPLLENPKATFVNKKAEELIGLTYDQFRQVIILPQGQFEKLLVSNSEEKEKILVSLFHAERWQRIAEELYRRVAEQDGALREEKSWIGGKLKGYGCETLAALEEKAQTAQVQREQLQNIAAEAEQAAQTARQRLEQALLETQSFEALAQLEKHLRSLREKEAFFAGEEALLRSAGDAERIRPCFQCRQRAKEDRLQKERALEAKAAAWEQAEHSLDQLLEKQEAHRGARPAQEENRRQLTRLETAGDLYRSLEEKQKRLGESEKALAAARKEAEQSQTGFAAADRQWQQAVEAQETAIRDWQQAQRIYLQGIGGVLAQGLAAGEPCPVCGSLEHPNPAKPGEGHVSESTLEARNQAMNAANEAAVQALQCRTSAEKQKTEAALVWAQAEQAAAVARQDYENTVSRKIPGIGTEIALNRRIADLRKAVEAYEKTETALAAAVADAQGGAKAAQTACQTAREELAAAEMADREQDALWQQALEASGLRSETRFREADMNTEERQRRTEALLRFRGDLARAAADWEAQRTLLEGKDPPDMRSVRQAAAEAETAVKEAASGLALADNSLRTMRKDIQLLSKRIAAYDADRERVNGDLDFANRLRGRSGVSLQRYVLGVMLTSITLEANRLLAGVYGGRYRLYRTDEIAGAARKGGLELEVYDSQNDQRRSVTTLSGGEKFLVALSLAIGLSTVVQAQGSGIRLEAMFIDEGFGSLDREAVNDALEVLQGIQRGAGTVGIISHVEALAESIPARIEIHKSSRGSRCVIRG